MSSQKVSTSEQKGKTSEEKPLQKRSQKIDTKPFETAKKPDEVKGSDSRKKTVPQREDETTKVSGVVKEPVEVHSQRKRQPLGEKEAVKPQTTGSSWGHDEPKKSQTAKVSREEKVTDSGKESHMRKEPAVQERPVKHRPTNERKDADSEKSLENGATKSVSIESGPQNPSQERPDN